LKQSLHYPIKVIVNDGLAFITWHAKTPSLDVSLGSDTFIIKDGKISQQTFVGQLNSSINCLFKEVWGITAG
jgi:hypothetical protein